MAQAKGYKLVRVVYKDGHRIKGSWGWRVLGAAAVVYPEGKWVESARGPLFYYASFNLAFVQANCRYDAEIWEAEVEGGRLVDYTLSPTAVEKLAAQFWSDPESVSLVDYMPCYAWVADRIKLVRRVWPE